MINFHIVSIGAATAFMMLLELIVANKKHSLFQKQINKKIHWARE